MLTLINKNRPIAENKQGLIEKEITGHYFQNTNRKPILRNNISNKLKHSPSLLDFRLHSDKENIVSKDELDAFNNKIFVQSIRRSKTHKRSHFSEFQNDKDQVQKQNNTKQMQKYLQSKVQIQLPYSCIDDQFSNNGSNFQKIRQKSQIIPSLLLNVKTDEKQFIARKPYKLVSIMDRMYERRQSDQTDRIKQSFVLKKYPKDGQNLFQKTFISDFNGQSTSQTFFKPQKHSFKQRIDQILSNNPNLNQKTSTPRNIKKLSFKIFQNQSKKFQANHQYNQSKVQIICSQQMFSDEIWISNQHFNELMAKSRVLKSQFSTNQTKNNVKRPTKIISIADNLNQKKSSLIAKETKGLSKQQSKDYLSVNMQQNLSKVNSNLYAQKPIKTKIQNKFKQNQQIFTIIESPPCESLNNESICQQFKFLKTTKSIPQLNRGNSVFQSIDQTQNPHQKSIIESFQSVGQNYLQTGQFFIPKTYTPTNKRKCSQQTINSFQLSQSIHLGRSASKQLQIFDNISLNKNISFYNPFKQCPFQEEIFQCINLYRFLNRLSYKIEKHLSFKKNSSQLKQLVSLLNRQKLFVLFAADKFLKNLSNCVANESKQDKLMISIRIINHYLTIQSKQMDLFRILDQFHIKDKFYDPKNIKLTSQLVNSARQFIKVTVMCLKQTTQHIQQLIKTNKYDQNVHLFRFRVKMLEYLMFDIYRLNQKTTSERREILSEIILNNQWDSKIQFSQAIQRFSKLHSISIQLFNMKN